jgi:hypothetical protein
MIQTGRPWANASWVGPRADEEQRPPLGEMDGEVAAALGRAGVAKLDGDAVQGARFSGSGERTIYRRLARGPASGDHPRGQLVAMDLRVGRELLAVARVVELFARSDRSAR